MCETAGSAAALAARYRKFRRGSFILNLPSHHSITSSARASSQTVLLTPQKNGSGPCATPVTSLRQADCSYHVAATPPRLLHWHERDLRYAGSSPSSSGMWRCPRRCRRLSAPNSASTDAVRSRIALSTPSLVPSSAKAAASTDESAARSSRCDRC